MSSHFPFLFVVVTLLLSACGSPTSSSTTDPDAEVWRSLFNGQNLEDWTVKIAGRVPGDNYLNTFRVADSMIQVSYAAYDSFNNTFGHLYYDQPFSYYKLRFDYRFTGEQLAGGASWNVRNSGVMLHSQSATSNELGQGFPVSVELQLLGGLGEGERTTGNACTPGTAVVMQDTINYEHCINSSSKTYHGDQWVRAEAVVLGGEAMYFLIEGDTVLQFQQPQIDRSFINADFNGQDWDTFGIRTDKEKWISRGGEVLTEGYIALQAESHPIDFRKIELLDLCGCMDPKAKNYKAYYRKDKPEACTY